MTQRLPSPTPPTKPKDRSMLAIVLAVLLHILIAIIIYFTVFDDNTSKSTDSTSVLESSESLSIVETIEKPPLSASDETVTADTKEKATTQSGAISKQASSDNAKTAAVTNNNVATKSTATKNTAAIKKPSSTQNNTPKTNDNLRAEQALSDENQTRLKSTIDNQDSTPEYTLKKTKEYESLDTEIDKDSEQMAKLIDEVKKRNQQQIEQQRTNTLGSQSIPNSVPKPAAVTSEQQPQSKTDTTSPPSNGDYPITPIKPLTK
ncbi:hypothetical protein [Psychrobacter sp. SZ93C1]|uniref:hypothetical protein n=1 Tax=Psychrobacter sp. SZ93C1 TaxID=2792058 RepID=UPI0018CD9FEC|nr:hypothetical protein [Psychrobacter sp. SZ93C1]MBH0066400.1 hypothetical protein [Psychrobacter sp. SZ93C1]